MSKSYLNSIKMAREKAGFTQKDVEDALGLRSLTMRDYEIGRLKLPIGVAMELAKLYKVSIDELIGAAETKIKSEQVKGLTNFTSLFVENGLSVLYLDPILRAFLEDHLDKYFEHSLFELLTLDFSQKQKKEVIQEIGKLLFMLASSDGKITDDEIECIRDLLKKYGISSSYKEVTMADATVNPLRLMDKIELRHFTIWILYLFSLTDKKICYQEISFIDNCAEMLKINKSNYLFIKSKFVKEIL